MLSDNHTRRARNNQKRSILIGILLKLFAHRCISSSPFSYILQFAAANCDSASSHFML